MHNPDAQNENSVQNADDILNISSNPEADSILSSKQDHTQPNPAHHALEIASPPISSVSNDGLARAAVRNENFILRAMKAFNRYKYVILGLLTIVGVVTAGGVVAILRSQNGSNDNSLEPNLPNNPMPPLGPPLSSSSSFFSSYSSSGISLFSSSGDDMPPPPPPPPVWVPMDLFANYSDIVDSVLNSPPPDFIDHATDPSTADGSFRRYLLRYGSPNVNGNEIGEPREPYYYYPGYDDGDEHEATIGTQVIDYNDPLWDVSTTWDDEGCPLDSNFRNVIQNFFHEVTDPIQQMLTQGLPQGLPQSNNNNISSPITYSYNAIQRHADSNVEAIMHLSLANHEVEQHLTFNPGFNPAFNPYLECDETVTVQIEPLTNNILNSFRERLSMSAFQFGLNPGETGLVVEARSTNPQDYRVCGSTLIVRHHWQSLSSPTFESSSESSSMLLNSTSRSNMDNSTSDGNATMNLVPWCAYPANYSFTDRAHSFMADPNELTAFSDYENLYGTTETGGPIGYNEGLEYSPDRNYDKLATSWGASWCYFYKWDYDNFWYLYRNVWWIIKNRPLGWVGADGPFPANNTWQAILSLDWTGGYRFRLNQFERHIQQRGNETASQIEEINRAVYTPARIAHIRTTLELYPPNLDGTSGSRIRSDHINPNTSETIYSVTERRSPAAFRSIPDGGSAMALEITHDGTYICGSTFNPRPRPRGNRIGP